MQIEVFDPKYPIAVIKGCGVDFAKLLLNGETIQNATVTGAPTTTDNVQYSGTKVSWDVSGGTAGQVIVFTVTAAGSLGTVEQVQAKMLVQKPI